MAYDKLDDSQKKEFDDVFKAMGSLSPSTEEIAAQSYTDKFGKVAWLEKVDDWHFKVIVTVAVSPQFFAWVFGLGNYVTITGPEHVKQQMKDMLEEVHKRY